MGDAETNVQDNASYHDDDPRTAGNSETTDVNDVKSLPAGGVSENGVNSYNVHNSPEEDRLWNMVRANPLDFNAWTALIEETEKISEVFLK